jgi:pimeloyl-ACP methyl ester carboxylesterase
MNRTGTPLLILLLTALPASALPAQDFAGVWQGTSGTDHPSRTVWKIERARNGAWSVAAHYPDTGGEDYWGSVVVNGSAITIVFMGGRPFVGNLSADGTSISGTWIDTPKPGRNPVEFRRATKATEWPLEVSSRTVRFVTVDTNVQLEVLDWGGSGRPLILLAGLGNTAHRFDRFVPKLTPNYHVYGITRRGLGASSVPPIANGNYRADRLGDDVLAVMDSLKVQHAVLVGHSFSGEVLSSIGSRYPERVAGLIYLDAAYEYAYYDSTRSALLVDMGDLQRTLAQLSLEVWLGPSREQQALTQHMLETSLPRMERDLRESHKEMQATPDSAWLRAYQWPAVEHAILMGAEKYTDIKCPALAIYAVPQNDSADAAEVQARATAFERGVPGARVVRLTNATHFVFISNEGDVLREMSAFISHLRQ